MNAGRHLCVVLLLAGALSVAQAAEAPARKPASESSPPARTTAPQNSADAEAEADEELLEFLGSLDDMTGDQTSLDDAEVAKVAKGRKDD